MIDRFLRPVKNLLKKTFLVTEGLKQKLNLKSVAVATTVILTLAVSVSIFSVSPPSPSEKAAENPVCKTTPPEPSNSLSPEESTTQKGVIENLLNQVSITPAEKKQPQGLTLIKRDLSAVTIPPGTKITGVVMGDSSGGSVNVKTNDPLIVQGETIAESGSIVFGTASGNEDRLAISFTKIITPDQEARDVQAVALDINDQGIGIAGSKATSFALKTAAAASLNFISGFSKGYQDKEVKGGAAFNVATLKNSLLNGAASAATEQSNQIASDLKNDAGRVSVSSGTALTILFTGN